MEACSIYTQHDKQVILQISKIDIESPHCVAMDIIHVQLLQV